MELKHIIASVLILLCTAGGVLLASVSQRVRDWLFFCLVGGIVVTERMDVNFFSHAWYRGTTVGVEISLVDIFAVSILVASLLVPRYRGPRWYWPVGLGVMLLYLAYACFSVLISTPHVFGVLELSKIVRGILFFLAVAAFVRTKREVQWLVLGLVCAVGLETLLGIKQRIFGGMDRVAGSLDHANSLSVYLCLVGPVLAAGALADFPRWVRGACLLGVALAAVTLMLTLSRAGTPIFGLVVLGTVLGCISWKITFKKVAVGLGLLVAAGLLLFVSWKPLMARYGEATFSEEYLDSKVGNEGRGVYLRWARMIIADHFWGVGLNNWSYAVSETYGSRVGFIYGDYKRIHSLEDRLAAREINFAAPAHSLVALTLGELGVPGLFLFALVWLRWFRTGAVFLRKRSQDPLYRLGVGLFFGTCGIFLQSQTEWVYRHAPIFLTFHVFMGVLAALYYQRNHVAKALHPATKLARPVSVPHENELSETAGYSL